MSKPVCVVVGIGPGNGSSLARRFSREGYAVALLSRSTELSEELAAELGDARAYECDVTDAEQVGGAFAAVRRDLGEIEALIYNAGAGSFGTVEDIDAAQLESAWRVNCAGLYATASQVIEPMKRAGRGAIVVIGATASLRGGAGFAAFAAAKAAQRSLAQSMARHLGPAGIHVSLVIVDGVIDLPRTRAQMPDKPDEYFLDPDDIAETACFLAHQPRSAWTFELDVRPFGESW